MKCINIQVDSYFENAYPEKWGALVEISLKDGSAYVKSTDYPKGDPENKAIVEEMIQKFKTMTIGKTSNPDDQIVFLLKRLEHMNIKDLMSILIRGASIKQA